MDGSIFFIKLIEKRNLNSRVILFTFEVIDKDCFEFIPGQFISIVLKNELGESIKRSYSIANLNLENNCIELAVTLVENGKGTKCLSSLIIDDVIEARGPLGKFSFQENIPGRHIFIGTGTGIVPFRSMLNQIYTHINNENYSFVIIQGVKMRSDLLFYEDFQKLSNYKNYDFKVCLSRENESIKCKNEVLGYVQDSFTGLNLNCDNDIVYLCGNPYMIEDVSIILLEKNFSKERIITERYFPKKRIV